MTVRLPAFVLVSLPLDFGQEVVQGSDLRGDGVDLDPDSIRVNPGHPRAGQALCARAKPPAGVVGPDGAREEAGTGVGGASRAGAGSAAGSGGVHTGGGLADSDSWVGVGG